MVGYLDWCVDDWRAIAGSDDAMRLARSPAVAYCTFSGTHHAYERFAFEFRISRRDVHRMRCRSSTLYDLALALVRSCFHLNDPARSFAVMRGAMCDVRCAMRGSLRMPTSHARVGASGSLQRDVRRSVLG